MTADQKAKADGGKTHPILLQKDMAAALYLVQRVLDYGCEKYERRAWHKVDDERWDDAQRRHQQMQDMNEQFDHESGLPHRAHQIAGLIILFMHELGTDISAEDVIKMGKYKPPPQDHKATEPPVPCAVVAPPPVDAGRKARWLPVKLAKAGDHVCAREGYKDNIGPLLMAGVRYKVKATEKDLVLVENERGIKSWYAKDRFL